MKLLLRRHNKTLYLYLANNPTFHDLRLLINESAPFSVHLSLNNKDELLTPSPNDTLRSLGIKSGDTIYYSLDHSAFVSPVHALQLAESVEGPELMDKKLSCVGSKRFSKPLFLKKILLEHCGDHTCEFAALFTSLHAVMLDSGFVLLNPGSDKFLFSKNERFVSLRYTLPELIKPEDTNTMNYITLKFQNLGYMVVVDGILDKWSKRETVFLNGFESNIDLVLNNLNSNEEVYSSKYIEVLKFWRKVKDGFIRPLLIDLCDKAGLESPRGLIHLPKDISLKILDLLPVASVAKVACVRRELQCVASDNDFWKKKFLDETAQKAVGDSLNWKAQFAAIWRQCRREGQTFPKRARCI